MISSLKDQHTVINGALLLPNPHQKIADIGLKRALWESPLLTPHPVFTGATNGRSSG